MNETIELSRSENIALARANCAYCAGSGVRPGRRAGEEHPCACVYRAVFKTCYLRFRECCSMGKYVSTVSLEWTNGPIGKRYYGRKLEEYMADFCVVSRRVLDDEQYRLFRYHYILGADWKLCVRILKMDKGDFFHKVYRIEEILGSTFYHLEPYPLFPLYEYFGPSNEALFGNGSGVGRRSIKRQARRFELQKIA
jgi:hypothetical protein